MHLWHSSLHAPYACRKLEQCARETERINERVLKAEGCVCSLHCQRPILSAAYSAKAPAW